MRLHRRLRRQHGPQVLARRASCCSGWASRAATTDTGYRDSDYRTITTAGPPFNAPTNIALAPNNHLYVTDGYGNARVHHFAEDGS